MKLACRWQVITITECAGSLISYRNTVMCVIQYTSDELTRSSVDNPSASTWRFKNGLITSGTLVVWLVTAARFTHVGPPAVAICTSTNLEVIASFLSLMKPFFPTLTICRFLRILLHRGERGKGAISNHVVQCLTPVTLF